MIIAKFTCPWVTPISEVQWRQIYIRPLAKWNRPKTGLRFVNATWAAWTNVAFVAGVTPAVGSIVRTSEPCRQQVLILETMDDRGMSKS